MEYIFNSAYFILTRTLQTILWVLSLPLRISTSIIIFIRTKRYDPEKITCPACGFQGDSGTNGRSCRIEFTRTETPEKAAIRHICFRCGCNEFFSSVRYPAEKWLPRLTEDQAEKIKKAAQKGVL